MLSITGLVGATGFGARVRSQWRPSLGGLPLIGRALIDSGADRSGVQVGKLQGWTQDPTQGRLQGVNGDTPCPVHKVILILRSGEEEWQSPELLVAGLPYVPGGGDALIGWDILQHADLSLKATLGKFELVMY